MKIIILRQYLWLVLYWRVYINIPSLALHQICENGLFSKERVKHCTVEPLEPLGLYTDTCTDANVLYARCVFIRKSVLWLPCNGWELVNSRADVGSAQMEWEVCSWLRKPLSTAYTGSFNDDFMNVGWAITKSYFPGLSKGWHCFPLFLMLFKQF